MCFSCMPLHSSCMEDRQSLPLLPDSYCSYLKCAFCCISCEGSIQGSWVSGEARWTHFYPSEDLWWRSRYFAKVRSCPDEMPLPGGANLGADASGARYFVLGGASGEYSALALRLHSLLVQHVASLVTPSGRTMPS